MLGLLALSAACAPKEYDKNVVERRVWDSMREKYWSHLESQGARSLTGRDTVVATADLGSLPLSPAKMFPSADGCRLWIVDDVARALLAFDDEFRLREVHYAPSGAERWFRGIVSGTALRSGDLLTAYLGSATVARITSTGRQVELLAWSQVSDSTPPTRQLVALGEDFVVDNWANTRRGARGVGWVEQRLPLLVLRDAGGRVVRAWGEFAPVGGVGLPIAVSRGHVFVRNDTAWFVNALTGWVTPVWDGHGEPIPEGDTKSWQIAPLFEPEQAGEYVYRRDGRVFPLTQYSVEHVSAPTASGELLVVQALHWPAIAARGVAFVPELAIVPYIGNRRGTEVWTTSGAVREAMLFGGHVVTIESDTVTGDRHLWRYDIPQSDEIPEVDNRRCRDD